MPLHNPSNEGAPLALLTLGVEGDTPPSPGEQPHLLDGIHLRWAFKRARDPASGKPVPPGFPDNPGFPWYGFYLFRRLTPASGGSQVCAAPAFAALSPGPVGATTLTIALGTFSSDQNLILTEDFPAPGTAEIDLSTGTFLRFDRAPTQPCRRVEVKVGFVADFPPAGGGGGPGPGDPGDPGAGGPGDGNGPGAGGRTAACGCGCLCHRPVRPFLERVVRIADGKYRAIFGYENPNGDRLIIPVGPDNAFRPDPADRGQPTVFEPGVHHGAFAVEFDGRPLVWTLGGRGSSASRLGALTPSPADGIVVTAYRAGMPVAERLLTGHKGDVVTASLDFEAIDAVTLSGGPARLIDLCVVDAGVDVTSGWAPLSGFPQPLCLPVKHPDYPCQPGPVDAAGSQAQALARIRYGTAAEWTATAPELHSLLVDLVSGGPGKPGGITEHVETFTADPDPPGSDTVPVQSSDQSSLELLLAAAVQPAMAQMLGLYWVDTTAVVGQPYDYLLVADYANAGGGNVATISALVAAGNFTNIQAYLRSGTVRALGTALASPTGTHAYALPTGAVPIGTRADVAGSVGLTWDIASRADKKLLPTTPILFHLWRADLGHAKAQVRVDAIAHRRVSSLPIAPGEPRRLDPAEALTGWPPFSLFAVDTLLPDGWYSYRLSGIDIFGRWSALGDPADWKSWDPEKVEHPFLIHLRDTTPPPPPTGIQAWALDPLDPTVVVDAALLDWRAALLQAPWYQALSDEQKSAVIGLRVRWMWTGREMLEAPDTREFRIYFDVGSLKESSGDATTWRDRLSVVGFGEHLLSETFVTFVTTGQLPLQGAAATVNGQTLLLDGTVPLDEVPLDGTEIQLTGTAGGAQRFTIVGVLPAERKVVVDRPPVLGGASSAWAIGTLQRTYELFLPDPTKNVPFSLDLLPTLAAPIAYGVVGVSAADDKVDTADLRDSGPFANRTGNEGPVGGPVTLARVRRIPPGPGQLPSFSGDRLSATRADFHSRSFFTLHWVKATSLRTHVLRAMDETLFAIDRKTGFNGSARKKTLTSATPNIFDDGWSTARRQAAASAINALTPTSDYRSLSDDALRVLASLEETAPAFSQLTHDPLDPAAAESKDVVGPSDPPTYVPLDERGSYLDTLDGRTSNLYFYRTATVDGAYNVGKPGLSTPPVFMPPSTLPQPPVLVDAGAGDRKVRLVWRSSFDPAVTAYRIYRGKTEQEVRRVAEATRIASIAETRLPAARPATVSKDDIAAEGGRQLFYAVVAVAGDAESPPSRVATLTAFDDTRPAPPVWGTPQDAGGGKLRLRWTLADATLRVLVQRSSVGGTDWSNASPWLDRGALEFVDASRASGVQYQYRLLVMDTSGRQNNQFSMITA